MQPAQALLLAWIRNLPKANLGKDGTIPQAKQSPFGKRRSSKTRPRGLNGGEEHLGSHAEAIPEDCLVPETPGDIIAWRSAGHQQGDTAVHQSPVFQRMLQKVRWCSLRVPECQQPRADYVVPCSCQSMQSGGLVCHPGSIQSVFLQ